MNFEFICALWQASLVLLCMVVTISHVLPSSLGFILRDDHIQFWFFTYLLVYMDRLERYCPQSRGCNKSMTLRDFLHLHPRGSRIRLKIHTKRLHSCLNSASYHVHWVSIGELETRSFECISSSAMLNGRKNNIGGHIGDWEARQMEENTIREIYKNPSIAHLESPLLVIQWYIIRITINQIDSYNNIIPCSSSWLPLWTQFQSSKRNLWPLWPSYR